MDNLVIYTYTIILPRKRQLIFIKEDFEEKNLSLKLSILINFTMQAPMQSKHIELERKPGICRIN